ncbi:laminin subunit alpha-3 isoform X2 [Sarcophilus harrisii]|uniref:laminin subunit alpha-3 isoform X2 n=1 Tax=Sarcophilus harrisii TaxID=9305 RepID=UPI001301FAC1|nr:laminin subunit alpha-3 isoform X2 [Sarcophilus harrisii]
MAGVQKGTPTAAPTPRRFPRLFLLLLFPLSGAAASPEPQTGFSLHPPYFNLAEAARISATATCGEDPGSARPRPELYCKLVGGPIASTTGHTIQGQFCDYCNSGDPNKAHPVTNAIDGTERWWQSPPLSLGLQYNKVNVTLDLGQLFHVAYVLIKFANSPRPDLWVLERSVDSGRTYLPWQFFAHSKIDCWEQFGTDANMPITKDNDVICTTEYSRIVPLENGEVVVSLVNGRPGAKNFTFSPTLREFTKATNIRLRFLRTNTLLGHLISKAQRDPTVTRRYYYSIKDISIGGRCVCNGHAEVCRAKGPENLFQCECQHNTCGESCDHCCAGYNQKQWRPATAERTNECEVCNCHGHATDCYYDPDVERQSESLNIHGVYEGGGVCINCQHNTAGVNCEKCIQGYYRPYNVPVEAPHGCMPCSCNPENTNGCEEGTGRCFCKSNFQGENCERCAEGFYNFPFCQRIPIYPISTPRPEASTTAAEIKDGCPPGFFGPQCQACQCYSIGALPGDCDRKTGQCFCQPGFHGFSCEECAVGFFHYPFCQRCECNPVGVVSEICDFQGKCLCRFGVDGPKCDSCSSGFYSFPACQECNCDPLGSQDGACGPRGQCRCYPNYAGLSCTQCAPDYYNYPSCFSCQCSPLGSYQTTCDPVTGQCECRPGITGQQCDQCLSGAYDFPHCQGFSSECNPAGTIDSSSGYCQCQLYVKGPTCSICKPLYWNLADENPDGCSECQCDVTGTLSGVGECEQKEGECYCKPHVCGDSCNTCEDGYFALGDSNYFGCQGCHCDIGGSVSFMCDDLSGACQCREHIMGQSCQQPEDNYYFPDLHHIKFEIEDGMTPNGRGVRFGFNPLEFPDFSWRGYAQMTPVQPEVVVPVTVASFKLGHLVLRYVSLVTKRSKGRISVAGSDCNCAIQSKEIVFLPSKEPAFVTVPGNGFADPFSLTPGTWTVSIKAEGILLDYLVLLPSDYYEASILQLPVTEPCAYSGPIEENCLLYQHLPVTRFACALACEAERFLLNGMPQVLATRKPTPELPIMADISGREIELHLTLSIPQVDHYVIVLEYTNEDDQLYVADVLVNTPSPSPAGRVNIYSCKYSFLCRSFVVDDLNRVAVYELLADARIQLKAHFAHFLLHQICIIPVGEFSTEYVKPSIHCIASYGQFVNQSSSCVLLAHETPPRALVLDALSGGMSPVVPPDPSPLESVFQGIVLKSPQNQVTLNGRVPHLGQYVFIVHFCQPDHPSFPAQVVVEGGHLWSGSFSAYFCPQVFGCRNLVIAESQTNLDLSEPEFSVTIKVPDGKSLMLGHVLVVPAENYGYHMLHKKTVDKSFDFINNCGGNSFYIDPLTSSKFCKDSARSLAAFYNNGALPCDCHGVGAVSPTCDPEGGQCQCRPNVIGRQCTRCQTGYYGFPFCKLCHCGQRLCDEMTGKCICPPRTVKPQCEVCEKQSFSYHPLVGCKGCNCSRIGAISAPAPECDRNSGQCRCKPRITGRQCDRCASGFYHFPECLPCNCNQDGTESGVCDPWTGACLCKENVEGAECNVCRKGSFYLDPTNPKGCTSCFCFGISDHCHSTNKRRAKFVDMMGWRLETTDQMDIPVTFNPGSNSVVADVQELPSSVHSVFWIAPSSYLGDKVSSYGGFLTYQVKSFGLPSEGMMLLEKRPDVQLSGQQMTIVYMDPNNPLPDRRYYGRVQLVEGNFRHVSSNNQVSRGELMMVLSRLDGLHIRGLYFTETQRLTLGEVGLEEVTSTGSGSIAYNVEICSCPPDYTGDSCQGCSPGYYRDNKGFYTGRCVPCNCNGHSNRCQDGSGICINCQHNTAGANCERCKEGYYGDALQGSCQVCPCPHTNSFATGCVVNGGNVKCSCKPGYVGVQCERCAPGYFGNPQKFGGSCQPCNCNNNGQLINCDPLTGDCINQEPKDGGPEECDDCDSCVMTLLKDLEKMNDELRLVKSQLQSTTASAATLEQMKRLETQTKDLRNHLLNYQSAISSHGSKVDALEKNLNSLNQDFETLHEKVQINSRKAQTLYNTVAQTNQNAKQLDTRIQNVIRDVHVLLKQISGTDGDGNTLPSGDFSRKLAEANRMMREMRNRDFREQLRKAEAEKIEAQVLLNRIQSTLKIHQAENNDLVKSVRDSLNEYEAKINDLRKALQEATLQTKLANGLNQANDRSLEDVKRRIKEMSSLQSEFNKYLTTAESSLSQTNSVLQLMKKSQEDYEKLASSLNEVRQELSDKVKDLSRSSSKESLVVEAENHAQSLQKLAKQLEEIKRNTSGDELVRCAVDAATAYENIINAVKAAEDAANKAVSASDSALQTVVKGDLPGKAKILSSNSDKLLREAKTTQTKLQQDIRPALDSLRDTLDIVTTKKGLIQTDLTTVQDDLRGINRDDIDSITSNAKSLIRNANDITSGVLDGLNPIHTDVERIKDTYGSTRSEDFNEALSDANNSVKKLTSKIPDLLSKIQSINQQLLPLGNISDNVDRIRELIQQARDAANKVAIPMRFNGKSGVEVRLPNDLEDLKGYTSLSLFLQRPDSREYGGDEEDMFVMYLGNKDASKDYIGMAVRDGKLVCVYNLGDQEAEIQMDSILTKSITQEAIMDRVKLQRIFQFAKLTYFKEATSHKPKPPDFYDMDSGSGDILLNLDPENVVFYVGGYPSNFKLPRELNYPPYKGCIELDDLNENVLSLYNFKKTFNLNTTEVEPCRRKKEESDKNYFEGTGYARVPTQSNTPFPTFLQTIQTTVDEGLLFFAEHQDFFISLSMEKGYPVLRYKLNSELPKEKRSRILINDGADQMITIRMGKMQNILRVTVNQTLIEVPGKIFNFNTYYLGGIPISLRDKFNISTPAFRGCMKNLKKTIGVVRLNDTVGVTKKCSEDWKLVRTASFSREGQISFINVGLPDPNNFQSSFGFQTFQPHGILLRHQIGTYTLQISLENGHIELSSRDYTILKSPQTYMDGLLHYVSIIKDHTGLRLLIDDKTLRDNQRLPTFPDSEQSLRFGGSDFEGCITNAFFQRLAQSPEVLNLVSHTRREKETVSLGACNLNKPPFLMLLKNSAKISTPRTFNIDRLQEDMRPAPLMKKEIQTNTQHCIESPQSQVSKGAYRFGDSPTSHLIYTFPKHMLKDSYRSQFAVDIQTTSPASGLVFFIGNKSSWMLLYISKGRIVFLLRTEGKKLRLKTKEKFNDGKWHTVVFGHEGRKARLVIDGLKVQEGSLNGNSIFPFKPSLIFLGASPRVKLKSLPQNSFVGCLRNFKLHGKALDTPSQNSGVRPCLGGPLEKGVYFSQDGGHISFDDSWMQGKEFKIVFGIRPRSLTGILMHFGGQDGKYLSVYMEEGKVTATVDSGDGKMLTSVTPNQSLCDGQWHSVAVTLKENLLQLDLDTDSSYEAGQLPILPASNQQPLYLGGIPANLTTLTLPVQKTFFGCLKKITINNAVVSVTKALEVWGAVSLNGCPVH